MSSFEQTPNPFPLDVYATSGALTAGRLTAYTPEAAAGVGALMPDLDPGFGAEPTPERLLRKIVESPDSAQLIVVRHELEDVQRARIVGAATVSITIGAGFGIRGQLEDVVTPPSERGRQPGQEVNAAGLLWDSIVGWHVRHAELNNPDNYPAHEIGEDGKPHAFFSFESETDRISGHKFYFKNGAVIPDPQFAPSHFKRALTDEDYAKAGITR